MPRSGRSFPLRLAHTFRNKRCSGGTGSIKKYVKHGTLQRVAAPTGILVGLSDDLAGMCTEVLGEAGLRVLRAGHVAAASERIPVVMPQLVVIGASIRQEELEGLNDRCVAVGAQVIRLTRDTKTPDLIAELKTAATNAMIKALRGG